MSRTDNCPCKRTIIRGKGPLFFRTDNSFVPPDNYLFARTVICWGRQPFIPKHTYALARTVLLFCTITLSPINGHGSRYVHLDMTDLPPTVHLFPRLIFLVLNFYSFPRTIFVPKTSYFFARTTIHSLRQLFISYGQCQVRQNGHLCITIENCSILRTIHSSYG